MKKLFSTLCAVMILMLVAPQVNAAYFVQIESCSSYAFDCPYAVIKCRTSGGVICNVSSQIPCEEAC